MSKQLWLIVALLVMALILLALGGMWFVLQFREPTMTSGVPDSTVEATQAIASPTVTQTATLVPPTSIPTSTPTKTPEPTPTATPKVIDYRLNGMIDLSSEVPVAMAIYKLNGDVIVSNWASPIAYFDGEDPDAFDPHKGTIKSYRNDGYVSTWIHSGYLIGGDELFGYGLEKAVWFNKKGQITNLADGHTKTTELIGATVVICQANAEANIRVFDKFDPKSGCPGIALEFTLTAATLIERESVELYKAAPQLVSWLVSNYPGTGFDSLKQGDSYLIQTCVGKYADQVSDGTVSYLYNRLVIGLVLK